MPFGLEQVGPRHYREKAKILWENRREIPYAWRILTRGVCDGCALGSTGMRDWTIDGTHLCMVRLELLSLNTMPPLDTGKQFNSMVHRETDPLTGAARKDILISDEDARALSISDGEAIRLVSVSGEFTGAAFIAPIKPGNLEVYWPEGMALLSGSAVDPKSGEPDYNALVRLEKVGGVTPSRRALESAGDTAGGGPAGPSVPRLPE